jgi:2-polyprenyl-3-methyl-5-hydroxy-6-metoxy-1,4-benzoquinol methylase
VGSGSGRECFALAREGFVVTGLDFAPAMVERARAGARRRGLAVEFRLGDVRSEALPDAPFDAVLFTYDVYSFLPTRDGRIDALRRVRGNLSPQGSLFLSARRLRSAYGGALLGLQWVAARGRVEWGDSHTRYLSSDGRLRRSFVHLFSSRRLRAEIEAAGFAQESWRRAHGVLVPRLL